MTPDQEIEARLEAPGAGLPKLELWIARRIFRSACRKLDGRAAAAVIETERRALLRIEREHDEPECSRRVLIKRLPGLEDSSRYWSVYMTLDHLRIVNLAVAGALSELSAGRVPLEEASTAAVKPSPAAGPGVAAAFDESCAAVSQAAAEMKDGGVRYAHPWFGPLDPHGWHVMAGFHMRLHHRQIDRILAAG